MNNQTMVVCSRCEEAFYQECLCEDCSFKESLWGPSRKIEDEGSVWLKVVPGHIFSGGEIVSQDDGTWERIE